MNSLEHIIDDFEFLDDWDDRYRYVIELGKALPDLPEDKKTLGNKVMGCASQVWLVSHISGDPSDPAMTFEGDSDAHIVAASSPLCLPSIPAGKPPRSPISMLWTSSTRSASSNTSPPSAPTGFAR